MATFILQTGIALVAAAGLLPAYTWMKRRAPLAAALFAAGLLARTAIGVGLSLSWLLIAPPDQRFDGDARWFPDARFYYDGATLAADHGLNLVGDDEASPTYVRALALWMRTVGQSHGAAHLLNLLVYAGLCMGIVAVLSRDRSPRGRGVAAVVVGAFSFSPNFVIMASQPLKDTVFFGALALVTLSVFHLVDDRGTEPRRLAPVPLAALLLGMYIMSGMRAYYGLMILGVFGGAMSVRWLAGVIQHRGVPWRMTMTSVVIVATMWLGCRIGGGPYYLSLIEPVVTSVTTRVTALSGLRLWPRDRASAAPAAPAAPPVSSAVISTIDQSRRGFEMSGGATNMAAPPELDRSTDGGGAGRLRSVLLGVAAVFVPVTLLKATGLVSFTGGGRMLLLTDVDTLFLDAAIVTCLVLVWRRRHQIEGNWTFAAFGLALGIVSAVMVGYVVTNYGTLFRLRLLAVVPLWLVPMALARRPVAGIIESATERTQAAPVEPLAESPLGSSGRA